MAGKHPSTIWNQRNFTLAHQYKKTKHYVVRIAYYSDERQR